MNNIIQNLAIQAAGKGFNTFSTSDLDTQEKIERFAELIIRECAKVLTQHGAYSSEGESYHYAASLIEEHFGVKE
jgi:hypothetical protein